MIDPKKQGTLAYTGKAQSGQREWQLQFHPEQQKAWENITDLLDAVRRCYLYRDYRSVQHRLGEYIEHFDAAAENARARYKRASTQLRRFPYRKDLQASTTLTKLENDCQQAEFDHTLYTRLSRQYRTVGDALAWQIYGFQALPIYALGLNQSPGPISLSKEDGAQAEKDKIEELWSKRGAFALRHDYTNNLRVWDLSVFSSEQPNLAEIMEIKVEGRKVKSKQKKIGQIISELVGYNMYTRPDGELFVHRKLSSQIANGTVQNNLNLLQQAIVQSKKESIGYATNAYLTVTVADFMNPAGRSDSDLLSEWKQKTQDFVFPDIWPIHCVDMLCGDSRNRMLKPGFAVPYTVYPLPPDYVSAIITGFIQVYHRLNTAAVTQAFREAGFEAECLLGDWRTQGHQPPKKGRTSYFQVRRRTISLTIHALPVEQLLYDGLPLEEFVASVIAQCDAEEAKQEIIIPASLQKEGRRFHAMSTYTSMEALWSQSRAYILSTITNEE